MTEYAKTSPRFPDFMLNKAHDVLTELKHKLADLDAGTHSHISLLDTHKQSILFTFCCSDFVSRIALQYPNAFLVALPSLTALTTPSKPEDDVTTFLEALSAQFSYAMQQQPEETDALKLIRQFRHLSMLCIAWCDFNQTHSVESSLIRVSQLANTIICETYNYTYQHHVKRYGPPKNNQQMLILGMGKLGGQELNFSSDIDLVFTYPSSGFTQHERKPVEHQVFFTKLAQKLILLLDKVTQDGQAYRVDMRLRPSGESGPLVLPFTAFENYYQEQGRQWERFAMQKMRIINSTPWNQELYDIIRPFVYRKYIDFTTIDSIREMKHLIEQEVRRRQISDNIKLGKGGIREVEFFVQSLQLIHAGRNPDCQLTSILQSMQALESADLLDKQEHLQLRQDYLFLRQVEHYLQAFNDQQTQSLPLSDHEIQQFDQTTLSQALIKPQDDSNYAAASYTQDQIDHIRLAALLPDTQSTYKASIQSAMARINQVFASVVEDPNRSQVDPSAADLNQLYDDLWRLDLDQSEFTETLQAQVDDSSCLMLYSCLNKFKKRVERSGLSQRALKSIDRLMPLLLREFSIYENHYESDQIEGVFQLLETVSGRVTYIDLLWEHPEVRARLLLLCKKSPWISQQISQYPLLLDELLHPLYLEKNEVSLDEWKQACAADLRQSLLRVEHEDVELVMDTLRAFKHTNQLRIAAADISGTLAINQVSDKLTLLAEVIIEKVIEYAWYQISQIFGLPQPNPQANGTDNKQFAVAAYGKFGGIELSYGSDLDVVFLHNADLSLNTDDSGSRKQISNQEFYIKLVQRIVHLCSTKTYSGILYDIDLRLRPSGNSGLLVSHINSFAAYQEKSAWTWEHQALVRSRLVYADEALVEAFKAVRKTVIAKPREALALRQDVLNMREKMREHLLQKPASQSKTQSKDEKNKRIKQAANPENNQIAAPLQNTIDLKQAHGGIVDLEFLVQYWVLKHAHQHPSLCDWSDNLRLLETLSHVGVISEQTSQNLCAAYLRIRHSAHRLQLANRKLARNGESLSQSMMNVENVFKEVFEYESSSNAQTLNQ